MVDFTVGMQLDRTEDLTYRKYLLRISLVVNLGLLGLFKYYNFFVDSFADAIRFFGTSLDSYTLNIILPVGISFYTFQTLSYTIDVYQRRLKPSRNFVAFSAFVSFFPQLVAGPIERATHLIPQFDRKRTFDPVLAADGLRQMLWGFFKKMVIADNCAKIANLVFDNYESFGGVYLVVGAVAFAFQIYGDFSGYSDIAIGSARLLGFDLMQNFNYPYFSRNVGEFWRNWHISLTTWFRDYVYIPLGGSRVGREKAIRNTLVVFVVSGFWHGANWTFIIWGLLNALFFIPLLVTNQNRKHLETAGAGRVFPTARELASMTLTFGLITLTWVFFRSLSVTDAVKFLTQIISDPLGNRLPMYAIHNVLLVTILLLFMLSIEWFGRNGKHAFERLFLRRPRIIRWGVYSIVVFLIMMYSVNEETPFIYFQF